jgi:purine-nucleoside phosphorylase
MGSLVRRVRVQASVAFTDIPGLFSTSVSGHRGCLSLGEWAGKRVLLGGGRLHFYEGHPWEVVVRPIRLAAELGVREALLTNASGGIRNDLTPGTLMPIRDHLEWNLPRPWRHPPKPSPYSPGLLKRIVAAGFACGLTMKPGVYAAVSGPNYDTPAEVRALRICGADAVGMSTSREVMAGVDAGLECGAISLVTNRAAGLASGILDHAEVLAMAQQVAEKLADVLEMVLRIDTSPRCN